MKFEAKILCFTNLCVLYVNFISLMALHVEIKVRILSNVMGIHAYNYDGYLRIYHPLQVDYVNWVDGNPAWQTPLCPKGS